MTRHAAISRFMRSLSGATIIVLLILATSVACAAAPAPDGPTAAPVAASGDTATRAAASQRAGRISLPTVLSSYIDPSRQLCRLGVGGTSAIASYAIRDLRLGWYLDWGVTATPARPDGISYHPMIRLAQTGPNSYSSTPAAAQLPALVAAQPGALWFIGNEPDRVAWQDSIEPRVYAMAYHDLYRLIKQLDPTARIAAGGIVQPTPLRLQYLDLVLGHYRAAYGGDMPVDVWNIHAFILRERSCLVFPTDCWGAEIPPGIDATEGMLYELDDHDDLEIFKGFIFTFRQWMADRGYRERPLILTEFGILMPEDYGFSRERVNAYMDKTFDFLSNAAGPTGYPPDDNRLVQYWAWYSLMDGASNGTLFDPITRQRTTFGDNFVALASRMPAEANLRPLSASASRQPGSQAATLSATLTNNGNIAGRGFFVVRFYDGAPHAGGHRIGADHFIYAMDGCGTTITVETAWDAAPAESVDLWVVVDPDRSVAERDETDNALSFRLAAR